MEQVNRNKLAERIIGAAIKVHKQFGPGLLVDFYVKALCLELTESKISFESPSFLPVQYNEQSVGMCKIDMVGNSLVLKA